MECEIYNNKAEIDIAMFGESYLCASCMVCGDSIRLEPWEVSVLHYGHHIHSKICDKCKAAILYMREQMP